MVHLINLSATKPENYDMNKNNKTGFGSWQKVLRHLHHSRSECASPGKLTNESVLSQLNSVSRHRKICREWAYLIKLQAHYLFPFWGDKFMITCVFSKGYGAFPFRVRQHDKMVKKIQTPSLLALGLLVFDPIMLIYLRNI